MRKLLSFLAICLIAGLVGSAFATYNVDKPTYFQSLNGSYITFDSSLLPLTFSTLNKDSDGYWNFNTTKIKTTVDMSVTVFCSGNWTNYTVSGSGIQQIYNGTIPNLVQINGLNITENMGWSYSVGVITVEIATSSVALFWGTVAGQPPTYELGVALNSPADGATSTTFSVTFTYTPISRGDILYSSELWLNLSGTWQIAAYNSSLLANYTTNIITYVFSTNNTYMWNVKIWNSTVGVFATSTRTLTIGVYVAEIIRYQITVTDKDLDLNVVDSYCTQQFLNGSTTFDYTEGAYTLVAGTVTIKTYYLSVLLNTTDFDMATYGNSTVTIYLNMKALATGGYIAVNKSATISILNQTSTLINATITASGTFTVVSAVTINATLVQLDGVNVTDWIFDAPSACIIANITSGDFSMEFVAVLGDPYFAVTVVFVGIGASISMWFYRRIAKLRRKKVP